MAARIDNLGILTFRRLSHTLTTSGQPTEAQFAQIAEAGIGHVINLARVDSPGALVDEAATVRGLGMRYTHIPVDFAAPTDADFAAFVVACEAVGEAPRHVHCAANYRVSAFLYRYRRERLGWSDADARPDLEAVWQPDATWAAFIGWTC